MERFRKQVWDLRKSILLETFAECQIFRNLSFGEMKEISVHATSISYGKGYSIFDGKQIDADIIAIGTQSSR